MIRPFKLYAPVFVFLLQVIAIIRLLLKLLYGDLFLYILPTLELHVF